jgi:tetratricopeptide (TPR) repeat protein
VKESEELMRALLDAYEILSNPLRRSDYDREFVRFFSRIKFNYREFLKSKKDDLVSQAKLIFYDLLNSEADSALTLHDELIVRHEDFSLEHYLGHEDYMDCLFLMAEALEKKGEYIRACELYKNLCVLECRKPYFHHFMEEVVDRLRSIACFKMVACLPPQLSIKHIKDLIRFNFSRKDNAFFYKKIAEIYCSLGQKEQALQYLHKGLRLDQKLPGVKKLKEKIGYSEFSPV